MKLAEKLGGTPKRREISALVATLVVAVVVVLALVARSRSGKLHVVNGLDIHVVVEAGGRTIGVGPQAQSVVTLPRGAHLATTKTDDGRVLERVVVLGDARPDAVVYNVLGAAPVIEARVRYAAVARSSEDRERDLTIHAGERMIVVDDLDYVFTEPPKSISSKDSGGEIVKHALMVPKGGWMGSASYLLGKDRAAEAADLGRAILRVDPSSLTALNIAEEAAYRAYGGDEAVVPIFAPFLAHGDQATEDALARAVLFGGCRRSCARALALVSAAPGGDTVTRKLTLMRALPEVEVRAAVSALSDAHADDPGVLRMRAFLALLDERWTECAALYKRLSTTPNAAFDVDEHALCLEAGGRHAEALALAAGVAEAQGPAAWTGAIMYARVASAGGAGSNDVGTREPLVIGRGPTHELEPSTKYIDRLEEDPASRAATHGIWLGTFDRAAPKPRSDSALAEPYAVALAASQGPDGAVEILAKSPSAGRRLPDALTLALGAEIARRGDIALAELVLDGARAFRLPPSAVIDYVLRGTVHPMLYRIDLEQRAALDFVRARRLEQLGVDSHLLYAAARRRDVLSGWVHRLMNWPSPAKEETAVVFGPPVPLPVSTKP